VKEPSPTFGPGPRAMSKDRGRVALTRTTQGQVAEWVNVFNADASTNAPSSRRTALNVVRSWLKAYSSERSTRRPLAIRTTYRDQSPNTTDSALAAIALTNGSIRYGAGEAATNEEPTGSPWVVFRFLIEVRVALRSRNAHAGDSAYGSAIDPYLASALGSLQQRARRFTRQLADTMVPDQPTVRTDQTATAAVMHISPADFNRLVTSRRRTRALRSRQKTARARRCQPAMVATASGDPTPIEMCGRVVRAATHATTPATDG
jgi:hypothetical protein